MAHITGSTPSTSGTTGGEIVRWFDRRGLTLLLAGTPYARSTSERATPVLIGWFLLLMLVALPMATTLAWWAALGMALAIVVVTWLASMWCAGGRCSDRSRRSAGSSRRRSSSARP